MQYLFEFTVVQQWPSCNCFTAATIESLYELTKVLFVVACFLSCTAYELIEGLHTLNLFADHSLLLVTGSNQFSKNKENMTLGYLCTLLVQSVVGQRFTERLDRHRSPWK